MRYVVVVLIEDTVRVFGTYRDRRRADEFAEKVNVEVDEREEAEFAAYQKRAGGEEIVPAGGGRALVMGLHAPRYREALAFALTGNPDTAYARKGALA